MNDKGEVGSETLGSVRFEALTHAVNIKVKAAGKGLNFGKQQSASSVSNAATNATTTTSTTRSSAIMISSGIEAFTKRKHRRANKALEHLPARPVPSDETPVHAEQHLSNGCEELEDDEATYLQTLESSRLEALGFTRHKRPYGSKRCDVIGPSLPLSGALSETAADGVPTAAHSQPPRKRKAIYTKYDLVHRI